MQVAVYDTYVTRTDGVVMHFDILVPQALRDPAIIHAFGQQYLTTKGQAGQPLTARECTFCHIEEATPAVQANIAAQGYHIIEMQGCHDVPAPQPA